MVTRPINPQLLPSRLYGRAAVGAVLPNFNQSLYARIAAQRAAFLQSQPQTLYDPGLNPLVAQRIRNEYGFDDTAWKTVTQTIGGAVGTWTGAKAGIATGAKVGGFLGPKGAAVGMVIGGIIGAVAGAQTGAAIGGLASPSGLIAAGELLRNTVINTGKNPVTGLAVAGVTMGSQMLVGKYLPGLSGMSRIAVANALTRVGTQAYLGFGQMLSDQDTTMEPNSAMSSLAAVANTLDNYSGASTIKAGLAALTGDEEDFMTILSKAYGWNEEGFTQLDFSRIRQNTGLDMGTLGNAVIDFVGEMLVDPGIWYSQMRGTTERHIFKRTRAMLTSENIDSLKFDIDGKLIPATDAWGKFAQALDNAGVHHSMSRVIMEHIFEESKHGRVVSKISKKKPGKAYQMFKEELMKLSTRNTKIAKVLEDVFSTEQTNKILKSMEGLDKNSDAYKTAQVELNNLMKQVDPKFRELYNTMVRKVIDGSDDMLINRAVLAQQSTDEVKTVYDAIMADPSIKDKAQFMDMNLLSDLKRYNVKIGLRDFERIKLDYPTVRALDDIDNFVGMTAMTLMNPAMAGARIGSHKIANMVGKGRPNRTVKAGALLEEGKDGAYKINSEANKRFKAETKRIWDEATKEREDYIKQRKAEFRKTRHQQDQDLIKEIEAQYDKEVAAVKERHQSRLEELKELEAQYRAVLWSQYGLEKEYGLYNDKSIDVLREKRKTLDSKSAEFKEVTKLLNEFQEIKKVISVYTTELKQLNEVLFNLDMAKRMYDSLVTSFRFEQSDVEYRDKKDQAEYGKLSRKRVNQMGSNEYKEAQLLYLERQGFFGYMKKLNAEVNAIFKELEKANHGIDGTMRERILNQIKTNTVYRNFLGNRIEIREIENRMVGLASDSEEYLKLRDEVIALKEADPLIYSRRSTSFSDEDMRQFSEAKGVENSGVSFRKNTLRNTQSTEVVARNEAIRRQQFQQVMDAIGIPPEIYSKYYASVFMSERILTSRKSKWGYEASQRRRIIESALTNKTTESEEIVRAYENLNKERDALEDTLETSTRINSGLGDDYESRGIEVDQTNETVTVFYADRNNPAEELSVKYDMDESYKDIERQFAVLDSKHIDKIILSDSDIELILDNMESLLWEISVAEKAYKNREKYSKPLDEIPLSDREKYQGLNFTMEEIKQILTDNDILSFKNTDGKEITIEEAVIQLRQHLKNYFIRNDYEIYRASGEETRAPEKVDLLTLLETRATQEADIQLIKRAKQEFSPVNRDTEIGTSNKKLMYDILKLKRKLFMEDFKVQVNQNKVMFDILNNPARGDIYDIAVNLFNAFSGQGNVNNYKDPALQTIFERAAGGAFENNKAVTELKEDLSNFINSVELIRAVTNQIEANLGVSGKVNSDYALKYRNQEKMTHTQVQGHIIDILRRVNFGDLLKVQKDGSKKYSQTEYMMIVDQRLASYKDQYSAQMVEAVRQTAYALYEDSRYAGYRYKDFNARMINNGIEIVAELQKLIQQEETPGNVAHQRRQLAEQAAATGEAGDTRVLQRSEHFRELLEKLKTTARDSITEQKWINNSLERIVLGSDIISRMNLQGINYSELGKDGSFITLRTPRTQLNNAAVKRIYTSAFFTNTKEYNIDDLSPDELAEARAKSPYGITRDEVSNSVANIMDMYFRIFQDHTESEFSSFAMMMSRAHKRGMKHSELAMGQYIFRQHMNKDATDLFSVMAYYDKGITLDQIEAILGLTYMNDIKNLNMRHQYFEEFMAYKEEAQKNMAEYQELKRQFIYKDELRDVNDIVLNTPDIILKEQAKLYGLDLSDEMIERIQKVRNKDDNDESYDILKDDLFKELIRSKYGDDAFETISEKDRLERSRYMLKTGDPDKTNIKLGNRRIVYKKTGIKAEAFPNHKRVVFMDEETSGLDPKNNTVIEHGAGVAEVVDGEFVVTRRFDLLNKLKEKLSKEITELTNITNKDLERYGIDEKELAMEIYEMIKEPGTLIVAYNAQFDIRFVDELLKKHIPGYKGNKADILDAMTVYRDHYMFSSKLKVAAERLRATGENTHRAGDDAMLTVDVLSKLIEQGVDIEKYINRLGYMEKYHNAEDEIPGMEYHKQDPFNEPENKFRRYKRRVKSKEVQEPKTRKDFIDQAEKEIDDYISKHGEETNERLKDAYSKTEMDKELEALSTEKQKRLDAIKEATKQAYEEMFTKLDPEVELVTKELVDILVRNDEASFKRVLKDYLSGFPKPIDVIDKKIDNIYEMYKELIIDKETIDAELELWQAGKELVWDEASGVYKTQHVANYKYTDEGVEYNRYKKRFQDMNDFEKEQHRRMMIQDYIVDMIRREIQNVSETNPWTKGSIEDDARLKAIQDKKLNRNLTAYYDELPKDMAIDRVNQFYDMTLEDMKMYFIRSDGTVDIDNMYKFLIEDPTYRLVATVRDTGKHVRSVYDPDYKPETDQEAALFERQKQSYEDSRDPETGVMMLDQENPNVKQVVLQSPEDLRILLEQGQDLSIGMMSVEHFKNARSRTNKPYKLPGPLDFYYRNILRLQKKDMLLRFSFHPRNFIDVIRKNSTIMGSIWDVPDFLDKGAKAFQLYNKWNGYQKEIVEYMNHIHKLHEVGVKSPETDTIVQNLRGRMQYLENEILKNKDVKTRRGREQLDMDTKQYEAVKKLVESFDSEDIKTALKNVYDNYDKIGFGAYMRQHHYKNYSLDYLETTSDLNPRDIDTYVYLKLRKSKKFRQASREVQQEMLREGIEDQINLLDMTNIFEKTSATTDINAFIKRLNKQKIDGEELPIGDRIFQTLATDNWLSKKYMSIGTQIEQVARLHGYLLDQHLYGYGHEEAIARSLKRHYDYSDQSPAEMWATMIFPFHAFPTRNAMFWAGMFQDASQIRTMHNLIVAAWGSVDEEEKESDYIQNAMINGYIPVGNTLIRLGDSRASAYGLFLNPQKEATGRLNPLIREAVNQLNGGGYKGIDLLRNIPIARFAPETLAALDRRRSGAGAHQTIAPSLFGTMYRYDTDGRYRAKYENIYRNLYTAKGKQRTPSKDAYYRVRSIMYDMKRRQYAR